MPLVIPPGFVNVLALIRLVDDPETMTTACGYEVDTPPFTQANSDAIADGFALILRELMTDDYEVIGVVCIVGNDGDDFRFESSTSAVGTQGSASIPQNSASLLKKQTGLTGRRNRGRMYVPGVPESAVANNGALSSTWIDQVNGAGEELRLAATIDDSNLGQAYLFHESAPTTPTLITAITASPVIATQRRRLR